MLGASGASPSKRTFLDGKSHPGKGDLWLPESIAFPDDGGSFGASLIGRQEVNRSPGGQRGKSSALLMVPEQR